MYILLHCSVSAAGMPIPAPPRDMLSMAPSYDCYDELCYEASSYGSSYRGSAAAADEKSSSVYLSVISQQTFIGCWKLNAELSSLLGVSLAQLQKSAPVKVGLI